MYRHTALTKLSKSHSFLQYVQKQSAGALVKLIYMGLIKQKSAFEYTQIQIILRMCEVSSGPLLSIVTCYSIK